MQLKCLNYIFCGWFILILAIKYGYSDIFTSTADMENLVHTEGLLISNLENYLNTLQIKTKYLEKKLEEQKNIHKNASEDSFRYITNPINAFLIIKRLVRDWEEIKKDVIQDSEDYIKNIAYIKNNTKFPVEDDLSGAGRGLIRLQKLYKLDTKSLTQGIINGIQYNSNLSSSECFEIGRWAPIQNDHFYAVEWMKEALDKLHEENHPNEIDLKIEILDHLSYSTHMEGDLLRAVELTNEILKFRPNHQRAIINQKVFLEKIDELKNSNNDIAASMKKSYIPNPDTDHSRYEMLCRGELRLNATEERHLRCRYIFGADPFLRIAPIKVEEALLNPYVAVFHDVLSNNEIAYFQQIAMPSLQRSKVGGYKKSIFSDRRISKVTVFEDKQHKIVDNMSQRTQDITNLSRTAFELTQVVNYGIGGFYYIHHDYLQDIGKDHNSSDLMVGDRIATVLYYLSDVEQGGATVFPRFKLSVRPRKGSALFWYNLYTSGVPDVRTFHAACPVLIGSKWIANKWIHEFDQEFRRPCKLYLDNPTEEQLLKDYILT